MHAALPVVEIKARGVLWRISRNIGAAALRVITTALMCSLLFACAQRPVMNDAARTASVLLLGEVHDNAEGHRQRLALLESRIAEGWRPAIAMEQFDRERQADLDSAMQRCADADCVVKAVGGQAWQWSLYLPVITLAQRYKLPLLAANLSRDDAVRVMREGLRAAFDMQSLALWRLDQPIPADLAESQRREIIEGHCNKLPASMVDGMLRAQLARDVWMARIISPYAQRGVVLLAGNGHVRKDVGVPRWLPQTDGVLSVGFIEPTQDDMSRAYDVVRVIPARQDREDPCAGL